MAKLRDILGYFCKHYPKELLSKARLTKLVYLADWKSCIEHGHQISDIKWVFNHFGPYVPDVEVTALSDSCFNVTRTYNAFGEKKDLISLKNEFDFDSLSNQDKNVLDSIIESTKKLNWDSFIQLIYSTYPIMVSMRKDILNLPELAKNYKEQ